MSDAAETAGSALLDAAAEAVFGTEPGGQRLAPLLAQYTQEVGLVRQDDQDCALLQAVRSDWALCDAPVPGGDGVGDTWLRRCLGGSLPGVDPPPAWRNLASSYVGLFEVWPGRKAFLRDRLRGLCIVLADPVTLAATGQEGPAALWELRITIDRGEARMLRAPLTYPLAILDRLARAAAARFGPGGEPLSLLRLRRALLQYRRAPRADPRTFFDRV